MYKNHVPKYMVGCEVTNPGVITAIRRLRFKFRGKIQNGISMPSFDHITFGQPFVTTYEEASRISLGIDLVALRITMGEHIFSLGEAKFFESKELNTLYLEVNTDKEVLGFLKKLRDGFFAASDITMLGPRLDDGEPKLHITLFQGKDIAKKSERLLRDIESYNQTLQTIRREDPERLTVFETFIPIMYAKYKSGWRMLSRNPEQDP